MNAEMAPPGVLRAIEVPAGEFKSLPLPFQPSAETLASGFSDQASNADLYAFQWDGAGQVWQTGIHDAGSGWRGDGLELRTGNPVQVFNASSDSLILRLGGVLPAAPLSIDTFPGLTRLGSPRLENASVADWSPKAVKFRRRRAAFGWMVLYDEDNQPIAYRSPGRGRNGWRAYRANTLPTLSPDSSYFLLYLGWNAMTLEGEVQKGYDPDALPAVRGVSYEAQTRQAVITVETSGESGALVDVFTRDLALLEDAESEGAWALLGHRIPSGEGMLELFDPQVPTHAGARLYQAADANLDADADGLSDAVEELVTGSDPHNADADGDGLSDGEEYARGTDMNNADTDGDGMTDGDEILHNCDPLHPDHPDVEFTVFTHLR